MSSCAVCHKPVKSGVVVHSECMPSWISVKDRLLEKNGIYLCNTIFAKNGISKCEIRILHFIVKDFLHEDFSWACGDGILVTHWMPLPAPPEVE